MSSKWAELSIADLCTSVFSGGTPTSTVSEYFDGGSIPWLKTKEVNYGKIKGTENHITEAGLKNSSAKLVPINSVIVAMYGNGDTAGRVAVNKIELTTNQACCNLIVDSDKADYRFVYYYLQSQYSKLVDLKNGGAQQNLSAKLIKNYPVLVPPPTEQKSIGSFLEALDDRITLLRETNTTLEAIAWALFKSWFVDFDPVRSKSEGRQPEGMGTATAALFPDSFEESELGGLPKGWSVRSLDSIADYLNGLALQKYPPSNESWLPVIKIAQLRKGDTVGADRANRNIKPEYIINNGDVLFSWSGSLEVAIWCGGEGALNQHLFKVTSTEFPKWFYYLWTCRHLSNFQQIAASKATTMGHIQRKHLTEAKVVVPPAEIIREAGVCIEPLLDRWLENAEQAKSLTQLRDSLLPRLISGQLRLPEAEALVAVDASARVGTY